MATRSLADKRYHGCRGFPSKRPRYCGSPGTRLRKPVRCQKLSFHYIHNASGVFLWQHYVKQANGKNLVRTNGRIAHLAVHDIVEAAG
jgi:hypothetical protein